MYQAVQFENELANFTQHTIAEYLERAANLIIKFPTERFDWYGYYTRNK